MLDSLKVDSLEEEKWDCNGGIALEKRKIQKDQNFHHRKIIKVEEDLTRNLKEMMIIKNMMETKGYLNYLQNRKY